MHNDLKDIYHDCDYISIHVPLNKDTKYLINEGTINAMKDEVRILNFARGDLVNDADIIKALNSGKVAAYVTDFPSDAVLGVENVIALPHLGASTPESEENCAYMAALELKNFLESGNISNSVNMPKLELARAGDVRICVIHKNVPSMISKISEACADVNIENILSKSRGDIAYCVIDVSGDEAKVSDIVAKIGTFDGIIRTWFIK